jgi:DNA-binding beta-propeller fold protein YncE
MHRVPRALLLASLFLGCDATRPTESPTTLGARPSVSAGVDLSETALLVGNFTPMAAGNSILRYTDGGRFVDVMVDLGLPDGPRGGCCMTFGPDENLYVSAAGGAAMPGRINRFNGVTGEFIDEFIPPGPTAPTRPLTMVFGPDGHLYVGDIGPHSIRRYDGQTGANLDADGHFVDPGAFGPTGPQLFTFGSDGKLYIVAPANLATVPDFYGAVRRFDPATGQIDDFVTGTIAEPVNSGLTFGPDGHLYVGAGNGVNRYDGLTGAPLGTFVAQASAGLGVPVGMVFGPDGNFYVANPGTVGDGNVLRFDGETGAFIDAFIPSSEAHITAPRIIEFKSSITVCHRPPGNPQNEKNISVGYLTAGDHVRHGDLVGPCP